MFRLIAFIAGLCLIQGLFHNTVLTIAIGLLILSETDQHWQIVQW